MELEEWMKKNECDICAINETGLNGNVSDEYKWIGTNRDWLRGKTSGSKRHSLHAVELSQRSGRPCANCVDPSRHKQWVANYCFFGKPAMRTHWKAGNAPHKSGRCRD